MTQLNTKEKILVVCPGRGSYSKETLNFFQRFRERPDIQSFIADVDRQLLPFEGISVSQLDALPAFSIHDHTRGEKASPLIYTCALSDYMSLDPEKCEVVAVAGNSMGWYLACACAGALDRNAAFKVIYTMGAMMKERLIGGQLLYPIVDEQWKFSPAKRALITDALAQFPGEAYLSIFLGGYAVIGGTEKAISQLSRLLPKEDIYPMKLANHAAFHTPLLAETSRMALEILPPSLFSTPHTPLIDGRGHIWQPYATDLQEMHRYTFDHQVVLPYDFTKSIEVGLKEFAPTRIVLLGPGNTLGGALGQILISLKWQGITCKADFLARQKENPVLVSMSLPAQRSLVSNIAI